jgi:YD repeat-containing protein
MNYGHHIFSFYDKFDKNNRGRGKLHQIKRNNAQDEEFTYDALGRLAEYHKFGDGYFRYTYTPNGQLHTIDYPTSRFKVAYSYTSTGKLNEIRNSDDNSLT